MIKFGSFLVAQLTFFIYQSQADGRAVQFGNFSPGFIAKYEILLNLIAHPIISLWPAVCGGVWCEARRKSEM